MAALATWCVVNAKGSSKCICVEALLVTVVDVSMVEGGSMVQKEKLGFLIGKMKIMTWHHLVG